MDYRQLEVFRAVMQTGSVTAAARTLNLSQPAVTKILQRTEDQLRFSLFDRVKGRLVPTVEAQALFPDVERVFDDLRDVSQMVDSLRETRSGALTIVTIPTLGWAALPRAIAAFLSNRPEVRLKFEVRPRRDIVQRIATQRADLGFAFLAEEHANVTSTPLCAGRVACIVPSGSELASHRVIRPTDLQAHRLISFSEEQALRPILDAALGGTRIRADSIVEVGWVANAWALVNEGVGIALVDDFSKLQDVYPGIVMRPFEPAVPIVAEVLHPRSEPTSRLAEEFVKVARDVLSTAAARKQLKWGRAPPNRPRIEPA
jgi:DNA-binding transcriptional LysR family regulator